MTVDLTGAGIIIITNLNYKQMNKYIKYSLAGIAIIALLLFSIAFLYNSCKKTTPETTTIITHQIDTINNDIVILKPVPYKVIEIDTIPAIVDTQKIIKDYFAEKYYRYEYADTNLALKAKFEVKENALQKIDLNYDVFRKTTTINTVSTITEFKIPKYTISVGAGFITNFTTTDLFILSNFSFNRNNIEVGYGILNKNVQLNYKFTVFRSKK